MGFFDRFFNKPKSAGGGTAVVSSPAAPVGNPAGDPAPAAPDGDKPSGDAAADGAPANGAPANGAPPNGTIQLAVAKKGMLGRWESKLRHKVDSYVDGKADQLLEDATKRAEEFRQETLDLVQAQAMQLLDLTEQRIDKKLVEIESILEQRLRAELRMRLRALIWTLAFVLLMALVSFVYVWVKRQAGLEQPAGNANTPSAQTSG